MKLTNHLHIVCLDAPAPPDYGGAIDMYYKIISLASTGKKIILHYFDYKKERNVKSLEAYCTEIHAYHRGSPADAFSRSLPFIVSSRLNRKLVDRLNKDDYPVLLEGIHCSGILPWLDHKERVVIRMHNEESSYYRMLSRSEKNLVKKIYYRHESSLLAKYYRKLDPQTKLACLSLTDMDRLEKEFGFRNLHFIPCFIPWQTIRGMEGKGNYCLYHGNMSVAENEAAASWLIKNVFSKIDQPLVIAGKNISNRLMKLGSGWKNIRMINNPGIEQLSILVKEAQINVLPSMNSTGVKLKLLHSLTEGRFCISNHTGVKGSGIEESVILADDAPAMIELIPKIFESSFAEEDKKNRRQMLTVYNNLTNANKLNALW